MDGNRLGIARGVIDIGNAIHTASGINKIHTWDQLGFIIYEPTGNAGRASSATFLFKPMGQSYDPKTMFAGWILVDGQRYPGTSRFCSTALGFPTAVRADVAAKLAVDVKLSWT